MKALTALLIGTLGTLAGLLLGLLLTSAPPAHADARNEFELEAAGWICVSNGGGCWPVYAGADAPEDLGSVRCVAFTMDISLCVEHNGAEEEAEAP